MWPPFQNREDDTPPPGLPSVLRFAQAAPLSLLFPPCFVQAPPTHGGLCSGLPPLGSRPWPVRLRGHPLRPRTPRDPTLLCFASLITPGLPPKSSLTFLVAEAILILCPRSRNGLEWTVGVQTVSLADEQVESEPLEYARWKFSMSDETSNGEGGCHGKGPLLGVQCFSCSLWRPRRVCLLPGSAGSSRGAGRMLELCL